MKFLKFDMSCPPLLKKGPLRIQIGFEALPVPRSARPWDRCAAGLVVDFFTFFREVVGFYPREMGSLQPEITVFQLPEMGSCWWFNFASENWAISGRLPGFEALKEIQTDGAASEAAREGGHGTSRVSVGWWGVVPCGSVISMVWHGFPWSQPVITSLYYTYNYISITKKRKTEKSRSHGYAIGADGYCMYIWFIWVNYNCHERIVPATLAGVKG